MKYPNPMDIRYAANKYGHVHLPFSASEFPRLLGIDVNGQIMTCTNQNNVWTLYHHSHTMYDFWPEKLRLPTLDKAIRPFKAHRLRNRVLDMLIRTFGGFLKWGYS